MLTAVPMAGTSAGIRHPRREWVRFPRDNVSLPAGRRSAAECPIGTLSSEMARRTDRAGGQARPIP